MNDYNNNFSNLNRMIAINTIKNISYIQNITSLYDSFRNCRDIFRQHSKSYYYGSMLFPFYKFIHICSFYAFVRIVDDIVDNDDLLSNKRLKLNEIEKEFFYLFTFVRNDISKKKKYDIFECNKFWKNKNPIYQALFFSINLLEIEESIFTNFFYSMKLDLYKVDYSNDKELEVYMKGSAYIVGNFMWTLMKWDNNNDFDEEIMLEGAIDLARAFQLTNFLRDIKEDYNFVPPRIYIPISTQNIMSLKLDIYLYRYYNNLGYLMGEYDQYRYNSLITYQCNKINSIYQKVQLSINHLDYENRLAIQLSKDLYQAINEKINQNKLANLDYKVSLGNLHKLGIFYNNLGLFGCLNFFYRYVSYNYYF